MRFLVILAVCFPLFSTAAWALDQDDPALVGVWLFDEGEGNTVGDLQNGNDGIINGSFAWDSGMFGSAILASGGGSIDVANSDSIASIQDGLTVAAWFRIDAASDTGIRKDGAFLLEDQSATEPVPNGFSFRLWTTQGLTPGFYGKTELVQGQWYHVAGTYDGANLELYINGEPESSLGALADNGSAWTPQWMGRVSPGTAPLQLKFGPEPLTGAIDEVVILNRALAADEIAQLLEGWANAFDEFNPADIDRDGDVDFADFEVIRANFRTGSTRAQGNIDSRGVTDLNDFTIWKAAFESQAGGSPVPEPATCILLALGMTLFAAGRRRRARAGAVGVDPGRARPVGGGAEGPLSGGRVNSLIVIRQAIA